MGAEYCGQVHGVTRSSEAGRAVIAAADGRGPVRGQCGIDGGAGRDDQQIRPLAKVCHTVSAGTDDETVSPCAASQRITPGTAIEAIIAITAEQRIGIGRAGQGHVGAIARIADRPAMGAGCSIQVHGVTGGGEVGRAVIAAAGGGRPIRGQSGIDRGAGRDDQHIGPSAEVGEAVSASADDETVVPRAASQRITPGAAIQPIIAIAAAEAVGAIAAEQRIGTG